MDKSDRSEEEYRFSDESEISQQTENTVQRPRIAGNTHNRRKIFVIIVLIVVFFCLYKLYEIFATTHTIKKPVLLPAPALQTTVTTIKKPSPFATEQKMLLATDQEMNALKATVQNNQQTINNLQQEVGTLSNTTADIQSSITEINQKITTMKKSVPVIKKQYHAVIKKRKILAPKPVVQVHYYVRALIKWRAWLMDARGKTLTVSIGDYLPSYGKITAIDPNNGILTTSSGRIIGYHPQDK